MPLNLPALQSGIESVAASPPATAAECAQGWADAVQAWATGIVPPSAAVAAATAALAGSLAGAFSSPAAAPGMDGAFAAFAVTVGGGMAGFAPVPPAAPVGFASLLASNRSSHAAAAADIASAIDTWMRTGIATLIAPPFTVIPWS